MNVKPPSDSFVPSTTWSWGITRCWILGKLSWFQRNRQSKLFFDAFLDWAPDPKLCFEDFPVVRKLNWCKAQKGLAAARICLVPPSHGQPGHRHVEAAIVLCARPAHVKTSKALLNVIQGLYITPGLSLHGVAYWGLFSLETRHWEGTWLDSHEKHILTEVSASWVTF